jgi:DNA-binding NarL/FixJ family response regulator
MEDKIRGTSEGASLRLQPAASLSTGPPRLGCEVLVAAGSRVFAEGVTVLLGMAGISARADSLEAVLTAADNQQLSVLVIDAVSAQQLLPEGLDRLRARRSECKVLLIIDDPARADLLVAATGATTWLSRQTDSKVLIETVRALAEGRSAGRRPPSCAPLTHGRLPAPDLTCREHAVLGLLTQAVSNDAIAQLLGISPNTVRTHVHNVLTKLNVHSRAGAVALAAAQPGFLGPHVPRDETAACAP